MNSHNESNRITINICKTTLTITKCFYVNYLKKKPKSYRSSLRCKCQPWANNVYCIFLLFQKRKSYEGLNKSSATFLKEKRGKQLQVCLRKIKLPRMMGWTDKITQWGCYENRKHWFFWAGAWAPHTQGTPDARSVWLETRRSEDAGRAVTATSTRALAKSLREVIQLPLETARPASQMLLCITGWGISADFQNQWSASKWLLPFTAPGSKLGLAPFTERWVPHTDPSGAVEDRGGPRPSKLAWAEVLLSAGWVSWTGISWPRAVWQQPS